MVYYFRTNDGTARRLEGMCKETCVDLLERLGFQYQEITEAEYNASIGA